MSIFYLMHKNEPVLSLDYDQASSRISKVIDTFDLDHAPLSVVNDRLSRSNEFDLTRLMNRWLSKRSIPASRDDIDRALRESSVSNTRELAVAGLGASLADCYWLKPSNSSLSWGDINFYENAFDFETGLVLAARPDQNSRSISSGSPNPSFTTTGDLKKAWYIDSRGTRNLMKSGSGVIKQEPFNEAAASYAYSKVLKNMDFVPYEVKWMGEAPFSSCPAFTTSDSEFVTAEEILQTHPLSCGSMNMEDYLRAAESLDIVGLRESIETQMVLDFVLGNTVRHTGNFGALRNPDSLEFSGPAPIFDTGLSLLCQVVDAAVDLTDLHANPFRPKLCQQLAMCSDFSHIDIGALLKVSDGIAESLSECKSRYMDDERIEAIRLFVQANAETVAWHAALPIPQSFSQQLKRSEAIANRVALILEERGGSRLFGVDGFIKSKESDKALETPLPQLSCDPLSWPPRHQRL